MITRGKLVTGEQPIGAIRIVTVELTPATKTSELVGFVPKTYEIVGITERLFVKLSEVKRADGKWTAAAQRWILSHVTDTPGQYHSVQFIIFGDWFPSPCPGPTPAE